MEKSSTSSLSSESSRESTGRAPAPLPRTKFMTEQDDLYDEKGRKISAKRKEGKREHKPKGTYSMIKDLLPNRKSKNRDKLSEKSDRSAKFSKSKSEVPPRPKQSKHKQSPKSRRDDSKDKEHFASKNGSIEKKNGKLKTSESERSLQNIFPSPSSQLLSEARHPTDQVLAVVAPSSPDDRGNRNASHGPSHSQRTPGHNLISRVTTMPKITTKEQLVETSQRAMECMQEARGAFSNSQYNTAARKYQQSLNFIDNVLETPLSTLHLTEVEEDKAQQTLFEIRLLRKDALQGFSDSQCEHSLPQGLLDLPTGAPPSYNDVLKEDLLMYTPTTTVGAPPLVPSLANDRDTKSSRNSEIASADQRTPQAEKSRYNARQTSRIDSQIFYTPGTSIANSHETRGGFNIVDSRPDKPTRHGEPTRTKNAPGSSSTGKPSLSVRPKTRQGPTNKKKHIFPPDVDVKAQRNKSRNGPNINKTVLNTSDKTNTHSSNESLTSETSFKSAVSTPTVTPRTKNIERPDHSDKKNKRVHKYPVLDPFTFEDPFPEQEPTPKPSNDTFSHLNGQPTSPLNKRLTHKISFLPRNSYHTEIIKNHDTNPFANSTIESPLNASSGINPFLHSPAEKVFQGGSSHNQFVEFRNETALPYPSGGAICSGIKSNYTDRQFPKGISPDNSPTKLEPGVKSVNYGPSVSVDDSMLNQRKSREVNSTDTLSKRNRLTKSVVDLSAKKKSTSKKVRKRHKLSKMKKLSRSNESILLMFDPIIVQESASSDTDSESDGDDFMVDKNTIQSNPVYGTKEIATPAPSRNTPSVLEHQENCAINGVTKKTEQNQAPAEPLLVIDSSEDETQIRNVHPNDEPGRPNSLYPKLSVCEGMSDRPLPELPTLPRLQDPASRSVSSEAREPNKANTRGHEDEVSISDAQDNKSLQSTRSGHKKKEKKPPQSRWPKESKPRSRHNLDELEEGAAVGRSAFYGDTSNQISRPSRPEKARFRDSTPAAPPQSSSSKKDNPWQEIVHINEAVKLFFLSDAGVSSPFNRQSLLLLRKYGGRNGGEGDEARIEVGGELFSRDLHDKNTMVILDHHGDYIVQSSPDVFLCIVLCSKVKRSQAQALENTFHIYANFAKESQMMKLPGGIESAAANVKKAVKDKAPGVMKTTSFVKRNSLRALRKLKGAIVGEEEEGEPKQEISIEFLPLKKACEKFREARQLKNVRYF